MRNTELTSAIEIELFSTEMLTEASQVLARAFLTNPLHVAAFGPDQFEKNVAFFQIGLSVMKGLRLVALDGSRILGLVHWVHAHDCQFSGFEKLMMTSSMMSSFGLRSALRVSTWLAAWAKHDPREPHIHLGPIGIDPSAQGQGIGRQLMEQYCGALERTGKAGYLETDRAENVQFYQRFGFEVTDEIQILGVKNYLMRRKGRNKA
jgi:predicted N-acetyltransferase YhbS